MSRPPLTAPGSLTIRGRAIAPGLACGPLRRNRSDLAPSDAAGSILLAERVVPEDVARILAAAGTLTISGAVLSHASLLSREFGKPSVSLSGLTPARLAEPGEGGLLVLPDVVGGEGVASIDEGDFLLVDGARGVVEVPGGLDREARSRARRLLAPIAAFGRSPDDERLLRAIVDALEQDDTSSSVVLDAALHYRLIPAGTASRRLLEALGRSTVGPELTAAVNALSDRIIGESASRCDEARATVTGIGDLEELQRAMRTLEGSLQRDLRLLDDLGADPDRLEPGLEGVLDAAEGQRSRLEGRLREEVAQAVTLPDEALRVRLGGLFRLLRRARASGVSDGDVERLHARLSRQLAQERTRIGTQLVVPLVPGARGERALVGGKAAGLIEIADALPERCRVPRGFVVTAAAYRLHLLGETGEKLRVALAAHDEASVSRLARAAILSGEFPDEVREAITGAFGALKAPRVALRSSATIEDGPIGTLAGLFDTYLGVRGLDETIDRIRWIWGSLWNARALAALAATGSSPLRSSQAVLVQEMVETSTAGVLFSRDPEGRPDTILVNAAWGLGEGVSQGEIPGDLYWVRRSTGEVVASDTGGASTRIALDPQGMGTLEVPLEAGKRGRPSLDAAQIRRLAELARRLEELTGRAQDLEFGFDDADGLVVLQVRRLVPRRES